MSIARLKTLLADERAQSLAEYALVAALVAIAAVLGLRLLGAATNNSLTSSASKIGD
jgi:Flp pilus assembly pilin Flp